MQPEIIFRINSSTQDHSFTLIKHTTQHSSQTDQSKKTCNVVRKNELRSSNPEFVWQENGVSKITRFFYTILVYSKKNDYNFKSKHYRRIPSSDFPFEYFDRTSWFSH